MAEGLQIGQLPQKENLTGNELIPFQQGSSNGSMSTATLKKYIGTGGGTGGGTDYMNYITEYNVSVQHPTSGIDGSNKYSLEGAIAQVPQELINIGLKVLFINTDNQVETWEYQGLEFSDVKNWIQGGARKVNDLDLVLNGSKGSQVQVIDSLALVNDSAYYALNRSIGQSAPNDITTISGYSGLKTVVKKGQKLIIKSVNNTNITPWALSDTENIIKQISTSKGSESLETYNITVDNDGFLYTNQNTATKKSFSIQIITELSNNIGLITQVEHNTSDIASIKEVPSFFNVKDQKLENGTKIKLAYNNIRKNYRICGYINLTNFNAIKVGKDDSQQGYIITVDSTNVKVDRNRYGNDEEVFPHKLSIRTFLAFNIICEGDFATLWLYSDSGAYQLTRIIKNPGYDSAFIESVNTTGNLISFSQVNLDYKKDIWLIQDSYGSWSNWGWAYCIYQKGFDTFLIDSKGGAGSKFQLDILKKHLTYATPKFIVWAMGMNDKDLENTYNNEWKITLDEVVNICKQKRIELILCTIPNVPNPNYLNTFKNRYIKELSKKNRYTLIDFADAVQVNFESREWKDGLIQEDNIHPNATGGEVLSIRAVTDFPQLINGDTLTSYEK